MFLQVNVLTINMSQQCKIMPTMMLNIFWAQRQKVGQMLTLYCGQHMVTFSNGNVFGGDTVSVQQKDKTREEVSMAINETFKYAVKSFACSHKYYDSFQVRAYTSARLLLEKYSTPVLFYANNYLYGGERYSFCMVQFADILQGIGTFSTCPAKTIFF